VTTAPPTSGTKENPEMSDPSPLQLFPPLDAATEAALTESIRRYGVIVPVVRDQHGRTIDGHHRTRIADGLGVSYRVDVRRVTDDAEAEAVARTLNADRRHLTPEQRQELVGHLRGEGHSIRAIAGAVGVDPRTVQRDLGAGVAPATPDRQETPEPAYTVGRDGKRYRRLPPPTRRPGGSHHERLLRNALTPLRSYLRNRSEVRLGIITPKEASRLLKSVQQIEAGLAELHRDLEAKAVVSRVLK
jgi:hypothetical protein